MSEVAVQGGGFCDWIGCFPFAEEEAGAVLSAMATTHLTNMEAQPLLTGSASGDEISSVANAIRLALSNLPTPEMDDSIEATLARGLELERVTGEPFCMGEDFAADMREILAMRRPSRGDPWES